jgi:arylsulfatase A-like enzyme
MKRTTYNGTWLALVAVALAVQSAVAAPPQCTQPDEGKAVKKSLRLVVACNDKRLRSGPTVVCTQAPPPACAGTLVGDAAALAYGPNNPSPAKIDTHALHVQYVCQKQIGKAVRSYVGDRLRYAIAGHDPVDAEARARRQLDRIPDKCAVTVAADTSGVVVPAVGPQCATAMPGPGGAVDPAALRDCLHTLVQLWVDRWGPTPHPLRPNIVFILSDDQRWDTVDATHGLNGTPVMPRVKAELIESGVQFQNAFMTTPLCCPSRSSILTGQQAHRTGVYTNSGINGGADDFNDQQSLPIWLQQAGYRTGLFGKYLNGYNTLWTAPSPPYVPPGWSQWYGMKNVAFYNYTIVENGVEVAYGAAATDYSTDVLREKARTFIADSVALGQPFFLYFAPKAPHAPATPAPRHAGMFATVPPWRPASYNEADVSDKPSWVQATPLLSGARQASIDAFNILQLESLQAVDEAVGGNPTYGIAGIMQALQDAGVADDTLVVYFADNGYLWGEHRMDKKNKPYDEAIRAPMVVRYPKLAPLRRQETKLALNIDFCPTFLELAGAEGSPPVNFIEGSSLIRLLDGTAASWRTDFLHEGWPVGHPWASIREASWKYIEIPTFLQPPNPAFERELYDLAADPLELNNLASDQAYQQRVNDMSARIPLFRPFWPIDADPTLEDPEE